MDDFTAHGYQVNTFIATVMEHADQDGETCGEFEDGSSKAERVSQS
jgi:hypothetical protein